MALQGITADPLKRPGGAASDLGKALGTFADSTSSAGLPTAAADTVACGTENTKMKFKVYSDFPLALK